MSPNGSWNVPNWSPIGSSSTGRDWLPAGFQRKVSDHSSSLPKLSWRREWTRFLAWEKVLKMSPIPILPFWTWSDGGNWSIFLVAHDLGWTAASVVKPITKERVGSMLARLSPELGP